MTTPRSVALQISGLLRLRDSPPVDVFRWLHSVRQHHLVSFCPVVVNCQQVETSAGRFFCCRNPSPAQVHLAGDCLHSTAESGVRVTPVHTPHEGCSSTAPRVSLPDKNYV